MAFRSAALALECVVNFAEGRCRDILDALAAAAGRSMLDIHTDPDHNRSVLTLAGPELGASLRALARLAVQLIDLRSHQGAHPRIGALDVVPFVPLDGGPLDGALAARDSFATWASTELGLPCFLYGPERSLPDIRRAAFGQLAPDLGPSIPHPSAGAVCVGARGALVAYNLWLAGSDLRHARQVALALRGPRLRTLAMAMSGGRVQVSCNLVDPGVVGPAQAYDAVALVAPVERAELVGLIPAAVLEAVPRQRWGQLDLSQDRTIEARLEGLLAGPSG
ncbi:MAG: glutamate formimidoyltransferase [Acidimicrobiales bacterium]